MRWLTLRKNSLQSTRPSRRFGVWQLQCAMLQKLQSCNPTPISLVQRTAPEGYCKGTNLSWWSRQQREETEADERTEGGARIMSENPRPFEWGKRCQVQHSREQSSKHGTIHPMPSAPVLVQQSEQSKGMAMLAWRRYFYQNRDGDRIWSYAGLATGMWKRQHFSTRCNWSLQNPPCTLSIWQRKPSSRRRANGCPKFMSGSRLMAGSRSFLSAASLRQSCRKCQRTRLPNTAKRQDHFRTFYASLLNIQ